MKESMGLRESMQGFKLKRPVKYLVSGALNSLFGLAVYVGLVQAGLSYTLAAAIATITGAGFNFLTMSLLVFRVISTSSWIRFVIVYSLLFLVNVTSISAISIWTEPIYAGILVWPIIVCLGYLLHSQFTFREPRLNVMPKKERRKRV